MLNLMRKENQRVVIRVRGVEIVVTVNSVGGRKVRLGFEAPQEVTIHREEVQQKVDATTNTGATS